MTKKYHKGQDRRHASEAKPRIFLLLEFTLLSLVAWFVFIVTPLWVAIIVIVALLYFFMTSSLKRYFNVQKRQQYYDFAEE